MIDEHVLWNATIGSIYERLADDEPWRAAIEKTILFLDASNAILRISIKGIKQRDSIFAYGPKVDQTKVADWEGYIYREIFPVNPGLGEVMFFRWEDVLSRTDMRAYMEKYDSSWTVVHCFDSTSKVDCQLIASRNRDQRPFDATDGEMLKILGGHFRQALQLRREILRGRLTSEFQAEGLDRMAIGGVLVDQSGHMILLNNAARRIVGEEDGIRFRNGHIQAVDDQENRRLQSIIREMLADDGSQLVKRAMALTRPSGRRKLGLVLSARRSVSLVSGKQELNVLIFIRDSQALADLDIGLIQQLFSFTRAETKLAIGLAKGARLEDLENELNIRHNTARAHLRSMFLKADVNRQAELVQVLATCVAPLGSDIDP